MKQIVLKSIRMQNFKKFTDKTIEFGSKVTSIFGQNYRGKSSIADAFSWVMFNKSSTGNTEGSQFRPRRYDENGVNIDHVDVVVEMLLLVDGEELKIKKTQRQEWVRHHGDDFESYTGDKTEYEWNDVPTTPTLHKQKVEDIITEEVFRMISNPAAFPTLPAKKQREFLLTNVANITDDDVFATSPEFEPIRAAMGKGTLEELAAKNKKELSAYQDKQKELPIRIDQESKRFQVIPNFETAEKNLAKLQDDLADAESRLEDTGKAYETLNELRSKKAESERKLSDIRDKVTNALNESVRNIRNAINKANDEFNDLNTAQGDKERRLEVVKSRLAADEQSLNDLRSKYMAEMNRTIDENAFTCPTCSQTLPEDKKEEIKRDFESKKAANLNTLDQEGKSLSNSISDAKQTISALEKDIQELKDKKILSMKAKNELDGELKELEANPPTYESNEDYTAIRKELEDLEEKIAGINTSDTDALKESIKAERANIQASIDSEKETLALKSVIEQSKATIEELKEELKNVTQSLANCEKLDKMIEKFNRAKMDMLSDHINDKFKIVRWRLFEQQKNGRFAETCVCMVNGSCYGDNTTSATEKMMAGMDIISTLQDIYQVEAPIFLDDADLFNEWNIPEMGCQLIKLCVSADEDLRVEGE